MANDILIMAIPRSGKYDTDFEFTYWADGDHMTWYHEIL